MRRAARRGRTAAALVAIVVLGVGCTSHADTRRANAKGATGDPPAAVGGAPSAGPVADPDLGPPAVFGRALASVPASVLHASFTNVGAVKHRLGYGDVTSASPAGVRLRFWDAARADGAMLTGRRLYPHSSDMEQDYGWTVDDVAWEIDFAGEETGCTEDMLCGPSDGAVLALGRHVDPRVVLSSLLDNGFQPDSTGQTWVTQRRGQPFNQALYAPERGIIAFGNAIGLIRVGEVVGGARSMADAYPGLAAALGDPESAYVDTTGCVTLGEALGPDATDDEVTRYLRENDTSRLAEGTAWAISITSGDRASSVLDLGSAVRDPAGESERRSAVIARWPGLQAGVPFGRVAAAQVSVEGSIERARYRVSAMATFAAMVRTHDAPWALCPAAPWA